MQQAKYWHRQGELAICDLCPHHCRIKNNQTGKCQVRKNIDNQLMAIAYGKLSAMALDPIEKKPLYHVKPGKEILSIGSFGCNFKCAFCQNWSISQEKPKGLEITIDKVIEKALEVGSCGIAYTYNEPVINIEFISDCAQLAKKHGLINVMVSNGYINPEPLQTLLPVIDAWNIDLKSMSRRFYRNICQAELEPVLDTIRTVAKHNFLEITHLMVPHEEHQLNYIEKLIDWLAGIDDTIPLHLTRFYPQYHYQEDATETTFIEAACQTAKKKLKWVYSGNITGMEEPTICPVCHELLIKRSGYTVVENNITNQQCPKCQEPFKGIL